MGNRLLEMAGVSPDTNVVLRGMENYEHFKWAILEEGGELDSDKIEAEELEFIIAPRASSGMDLPDDASLTDATSRFQQQFIRTAIDRSGGNMSEAATRLGLHRSNLYRKMRQLGMKAE